MEDKSIFQTLSEVDITEHIKKKNNIMYLPWSKAWMVIKTIYPKAEFRVMQSAGGNRYHTDGKTAWVETCLTIGDATEREALAVMDYKNASIPLDKLTSADVENSIKRCFVKNAALFGLGLSLWTGEEISGAAKRKKETDLDDVKLQIMSVASEKISAGVDKDLIYKTIHDAAGVKNPNAIKDLALANKALAELKKLEVTKNAE